MENVAAAMRMTPQTKKPEMVSARRAIGGPGPLCVLNHGDDFGYDRVVACMCYAEDERTVSVHGAAGYAGTGGFFHGHAFAGQHGFVNGRDTFLHDAVRRDPLSGFDADTVIGFELVYRNDYLSVIHHQVSGFRCELHQFAGMAPDALPRERASRNLPSMINAMIMPAVSK